MRQAEFLRKVFAESELVSRFRARLAGGDSFKVSGLAGSGPALLLADLHEQINAPILIVLPTQKAAFGLLHDLKELCGESGASGFPSWGTHPYDWLVPPSENIAQRIETVWQLQQGRPILVVAAADALCQPTIAPAQLESSCFELRVGEEYDLDALAEKLTAIGYERTSMTEEVGSFSVRGGILDIFPFTSSNPVRCEFFGDQVDSMRFFSVISQRSIEKTERVAIIPRREPTLAGDELETRLETLDRASADFVRSKCLDGFGYPGLEWVTPLLGNHRTYLFDYLPDTARIYLSDAQLIEALLANVEKNARAHYDDLKSSFPSAPKPEELGLTADEFSQRVQGWNIVEEITLGAAGSEINFGMKEHPAYNGQVKLLRQALRDYLSERRMVFISTENQMQTERIGELLAEYSDSIHFVVGQFQGGFEFPDTEMVLLTDHQIFERQFVRRRHRQFKEGTAIASYNALTLGDYVVHIDYGIGRYRGLVEIKIGDQRRDCLLIKYAEDAKLYVPIEEFGRVQKYVGKDGKPALTRLGGKTWDKIKARTKKAIAVMAEELLKLYAKRKAEPGIAFGRDDEWMHQLEASFPYEETPDQLAAIKAIKQDMETGAPTDRLVCGDVGFGKTEVAIRAALKAVSSGKQVAVLVPTTILAQQHLATFRDRLEQFPVRVEMMSRFKTRQEQKAIAADLAEGQVDIVIGTHRLLQKDIQFPDLGLLIVDEEHRFGVAHKEKLKKLRTAVDCLALSATPIPRTLHMSLLSVRDISLINTPPKFRQSIITEIAQFDPKIIYEAVSDEISRKGQVYFVHNRVQSILSIRDYLTKLLNPISIAVAHGQMPEKELEEVMDGFLKRDYDVLLSTSIIESGIDIPSVNTIVINRADRFGLAQLYQLRGRVGRSLDRAFAYLLVPPVKLLTDTARKRLKAIEQHTELGSGFHLAMKDLEIRGAGNLLGPQQHGFIEEVGFDLYCQLLEEAVAELKGEPLARSAEVKLESDADIYIPEDYIEDSSQRVEIYRRLSNAASIDDLLAIRAELQDRFGRFDTPVANLLDLMEIKLLAGARKIARVSVQEQTLLLVYAEGNLPRKKQVELFRSAAPDDCEFDVSDGFAIRLSYPTECVRPLAETKKLLQLL